jgi:hypothetical protein
MTSKLLTRHEAAAYLGIPFRTFERHVQPRLAAASLEVRWGRRPYYRPEDLDAWLANQTKGGGSVGETAAPPSVSRGRSTTTASPSERARREKLRQPPRVRTPMLYPVGSGPSSNGRGNS